MERIVLHIDVNSAFLSWSAVKLLEEGYKKDIRNEVAVVAGDPKKRHGIIVAASIPAKKLGIKAPINLYEARKKYKDLIVVKPDHNYYYKKSKAMMDFLKKLFPEFQQYSIDECFIDVTHYLKLYKMNAMELAKTMMKDILDTYKITATCGIGNNMYLAKIALDILSKHSPTNIAWLNEEKYIKTLGDHKPITDFWGVGKGTANRLKKMGIFTMNEVARCSEKRLYKEFGINARFLIDHSKGLETCTIADIKDYKPKTTSYSNSQILFKDYNYESARLIVKEMVELLSQKLIENNKKAGVIRLYIGYSKDVIKSTGGSRKLTNPSNLYTNLVFEFMQLFDQTTDKDTPIRKVRNKF